MRVPMKFLLCLCSSTQFLYPSIRPRAGKQSRLGIYAVMLCDFQLQIVTCACRVSVVGGFEVGPGHFIPITDTVVVLLQTTQH